MTETPADDDAAATDLTDFGGGAERDPPVVRKRKALHISVGGDVKHVGHFAVLVEPEPAATTPVYVTTRDSHDHRLRYLEQDAGGAYAVSRHAIGEVQRHAHRYADGGVRSFFVHEVDTGDVYEWRMDALTVESQAVPEQYLETTADPQVYVTRESAAYVWTDHAPDDFYAPRGGEA